MFCSNCGKKIEDTSIYCQYCGRKVQLPGQAAPEGTYGVQGRPKNPHPTGNKKIVVLLIILIILAGALIGSAIFLRSATPKRTIHKIETALNKMDMEGVVACFDKDTRKEFADATDETVGSFSYGQYFGLLSGLGGLFQESGLTPQFRLTVQDITYAGRSKCVVNILCSISYQGKTESDREAIPMILENGAWVIDGSQINLSDLSF
ncbi:MAG: zinc ribbon domain-containing protein [Lachnospiraceae bacterium]|nr:zinc ribbon domain-containing protein [Lachnospiraceae bacterium]